MSNTESQRLQTTRQALACLDLTSLNDHDSAADIVALCQRAVGAAQRGPVAAVCVWPRRAALARRLLPAGISVAAVANFPAGGADVQRALRDAGRITDAGAQEVDLVFPYRQASAAPALLRAVRRASQGLLLKVILETGEQTSPAATQLACQMALDAGADFLKTSTGKTPISATPEAATLLLQALAKHPGGRTLGFKPSGGIRTLADAALYLALTAQHLGPAALVPQRFRIGASSLLDDIEATLLGADTAPSAGRANNAY
jgi:deoxyribose-phosphate aldolase